MARLIAAFEQFFDGAGNPLVGGQVDFFESGSSSVRKTTYADSGETIANPNPLIINGDGRCPNVFGSGNYRAVLRSAPVAPATVGVQILSRDPIGGNVSLTFGADWVSDQSYSLSDVVRNDNQYWISQTNNNIGNTPSTDAGTNWLLFNSNRFDGPEPNLTDNLPALITGASVPATNQHIEYGKTLIQSKATTTTAGVLNVNTLGGEINIAATTNHHMTFVTAGVAVVDGSSNTVWTTQGGTFSCTHPEDSAGLVRRVLNYRDKFSDFASRTGDISTKIVVADADDIGNITDLVDCTSVLLDDTSGWAVNDEAYYIFEDLVGGVVNIGGSIGAIKYLPASIPGEKAFSLKYLGGVIFQYVGP